MGESSLIQIGSDNYSFDLDYWFPSEFKSVAISATGGIESTAIMAVCAARYDLDSVYLFHNRHKQTHHMKLIASKLGLRRIHVFEIHNQTIEKTKFIEHVWVNANNTADIDGIYFGMNKNQYLSNFTLQNQQDWGSFFPFYNLQKQHALDLLIKTGQEQLIQHTFSCHRQTDIHCGQCDNCIERQQAFAALNMNDPTIYDTEVYNDQ